MLKYFAVKNFKQFKEEISFDFSKVRDYDFNKRCLSKGLIKDAIIYGKNASGKTNFGLAVMDITTHLIDKMKSEKYQFYANADGADNPVEFTYVFRFFQRRSVCEVEYRYAKDSAQKLLWETFKVGGQEIFAYDFTKNEKRLTDDEHYGLNTLNWEFKDSDISILRYIANNTKLAANSPVRLVMDFVKGMLWFSSFGLANQYVGFTRGVENMEDFIIKNGLIADFEMFINTYGVAEKIAVKKGLAGNEFLCFNYKQPIPLSSTASSGTNALLTLYYWYKHFNEASFVIIDEFDAYYHFALADKVVRLCIDKVKSQVILTSHNTNLLTNKLMRPDCFFILKQGVLRSFGDATSREIREGNNIEKLFIGGEFGV